MAIRRSSGDVTHSELARYIWETRYRDRDSGERDISASWQRVAGAVAAREADPVVWRERFLDILRGCQFLPGGRILAGAGTTREVTLFNCFVMGLIEDSIEGIFEALKDGALTMQQGGGVGYDFSTLRPRGSRATASGAIASGPVSFLGVWDAMCATLLSTGARRGAMMGTLRCDHPDIEQFIDAKRTPGALSHFNLSVLISDAFMDALRIGADWPLVFPDRGGPDAGAMQARRAWSGEPSPVPCRIHAVVSARELWARLADSAFECAEPGVLFIDRINAANNLGYCELLSATNPCGEVPLPPYGACNLGSLNLTKFVLDPFSTDARLDEPSLRVAVRYAVRFLDDVIDISGFPLSRQRDAVQRSRRLGLGITGLGDALAMLGLRYDSEPARCFAAGTMRTVRDVAYDASCELAGERGAFPAFVADEYLARPFIRALPGELRAAIRRHGIRNSHLLAIAPAGTISLLAENVSSGVEPIFGLEFERHILDPDGTVRSFRLADPAYAAWRSRNPAAPLPEFLRPHDAIAPLDHLRMQAALQPYVDGAISKTIPLPHACPKARVRELLETAYEMGLKGCTVYRPAARPGVIAEPGGVGVARAAPRVTGCCPGGLGTGH